VLINNAGHGFRAAVEEADTEELDELFASNFFGPVSLIKAVLPAMRKRTLDLLAKDQGHIALRGLLGLYYQSSNYAG
jgi:NAD(P)-dependent dehydrogenase (short-subunit alcohol dehydrogenase family)